MVYVPGTFDQSHHYLQWGGDLPGGDEWSCSLRMSVPAGVTPANDPAVLTAATAAVQTFHTAAGTQISPGAKLTFVKMNLVDVNGHYVADTTQESVLASIAGGGSGSNTPPNQVALAVTLETGFARGAAHRGRFYLPMPMTPIGTDGRIATGSRDPVVTTATAFITALNAISTNADVAVFSRKLGAATHRNVTSVHVGRVLDTQRRRRNKLLEAY